MDLTVNTCAVITAIDEQSADIAMGVDEALESKSGEQTEDEIEASRCWRPRYNVWFCIVMKLQN